MAVPPRNIVLQSQPTKAPTDFLPRRRWLFSFGGGSLHYTVLKKHGLITAGDAQLAAVRAKDPGFASKVEDLLAVVDKIGFEQPPKMAALLKQIITKYDLGGHLSIV